MYTDLVVVGGSLSGTCAALTAARARIWGTTTAGRGKAACSTKSAPRIYIAIPKEIRRSWTPILLGIEHLQHILYAVQMARGEGAQ
jgi:hypothetical protein